MTILDRRTIESMNFAAVGENVLISDRASFYNCSQISIGDNVRVDDYCVLSAGVGGIFIGNNIHIAVGATLIGAGKITLSDFSTASTHVSIFSSSDDYSGTSMANPMIPPKFTGVVHADVFIGKHVIVGSGSVILPGVALEEGVAIGALSLIQKNCRAFGIYAGSPARFIKERKRDLLELERLFLLNVASKEK